MTAEFASFFSYYGFAFSTRGIWRYTRSADENAFLEAVKATAKSRVISMPEGTTVWRAQNDHAWEKPVTTDPLRAFGPVAVPHPPERMKPLADRAKEGRANPKGIPVLYVAQDPKTAVAEVRPWVGGVVSLATMNTVAPLRIVDCSAESEMSPPLDFYDEEPEPPERERFVWANINTAFSQPVSNSDDSADYVPTQILAETFKREGYDGIAYRSSVGGDGVNIALFDLNSAAQVQCKMVRVTSIALDYTAHMSIATALHEEAKRIGFGSKQQTE